MIIVITCIYTRIQCIFVIVISTLISTRSLVQYEFKVIKNKGNTLKEKNTKDLINQLVSSIQERKGKKIVIADLTAIEDTITNYFIICEGTSSNQVGSIVENLKYDIKEQLGESPLAIDGLGSAEWVVIDYVNVVVHVFQPEARNYYDLENLWADAQLTTIPDID